MDEMKKLPKEVRQYIKGLEKENQDLKKRILELEKVK